MLEEPDDEKQGDESQKQVGKTSHADPHARRLPEDDRQLVEKEVRRDRDEKTRQDPLDLALLLCMWCSQMGADQKRGVQCEGHSVGSVGQLTQKAISGQPQVRRGIAPQRKVPQAQHREHRIECQDRSHENQTEPTAAARLREVEGKEDHEPGGELSEVYEGIRQAVLVVEGLDGGEHEVEQGRQGDQNEGRLCRAAGEQVEGGKPQGGTEHQGEQPVRPGKIESRA